MRVAVGGATPAASASSPTFIVGQSARAMSRYCWERLSSPTSWADPPLDAAHRREELSPGVLERREIGARVAICACGHVP